MPISQMRFDYDRTTIRRYDDTTTHTTTTKVVEITTCIRCDCDTTTIRLRIDMFIDMFIFCSRRISSNGSRRARYVVVGSQSDRNCNYGIMRLRDEASKEKERNHNSKIIQNIMQRANGVITSYFYFRCHHFYYWIVSRIIGLMFIVIH